MPSRQATACRRSSPSAGTASARSRLGRPTGSRKCINSASRRGPGSKAGRAYKAATVRERHRHRYEVNNAYVGQLQRAGLMVSGINARRHLVEIVELKDHPWFLAVQFHPEFQSKPNRAHPLFAAFIAATMKRKGKKKK